MAGHPAGITVDAVREQLAALGHDDVSDDVIASFLDSLHHQVNDELAPVEKVAAGVDGAEDPPPPVERTDAAPTRGYSPEATAARTPGGTERRPRLGPPKPDETRDDGSAFREGTPNDAVSRNRRSTPTGVRPRPTSSGRRAATRAPLAIPTTTAAASIRGDASIRGADLAINSRTPPSQSRNQSSATRHRREPTTPKDAHEDIIGWCAKRSVASVTPGGKTTPRRTPGRTSTSSVIASSMPIRAGVGTPGQRVRIDRVARAAQYAAVWSGDAYLARNPGGKSPVSAAGRTSRGSSKSGAGCVDFSDDLDEATVFGTRSKLAYDVNGPRGGSWGRAQRKLTDGTNEWRVDVEENVSGGRFGRSGFWDAKRAPGGTTATGKGFKTPDERRRDALRWEVRARMAAPPTF